MSGTTRLTYTSAQLENVADLARRLYPGRLHSAEEQGVDLYLCVDGVAVGRLTFDGDEPRLEYFSRYRPERPVAWARNITQPAPIAAASAQASVGAVKIDIGDLIAKQLSSGMRGLFGPTADEAEAAAQASLVALVQDLAAARRRSESLQDQIAYLQERYWIVPKAAT